MPWRRPSDIPVGHVWSRFHGRAQNGRPCKKYQIRDVEPSDRELCLNMMERTFLRDEPLCQMLGIEEDAESISTIRCNWERYADQGVCVACYTEEDGAPRDLVGVNILVVRTVDDEEEDIENVVGEPWKKLLRTLVIAEKLVDVFELYRVDRYLTSSGLTVVPEHRGQNIGAEIIAVRERICKTLGIEAAVTVFTAKSSQVLAAKCGYEQLAVLPYGDMLEHGIDLTGCDTPTAVLMGRKFNINNI